MICWRNSRQAFWLSLILPSGAAVLILVGRPWIFVAIMLFVLPLIDAAMGRGDPRSGQIIENLNADQVPCWFAFAWASAVGVGAYRASTASLIQLIGISVACGVLSATAMAHLHELTHRPGRMWQEVSEIAFVIAGYPHYRAAHQLHHRNVGNQRFGSTARLGTPVWGHVGRSYWAALIASFSRHSYPDCKVPFRLFRNAFLFLLLLCVAALLQWRIAIFYIGYAVVSVFIVEAVGYMQHYGLDSNRLRTEITSWDVDFWLSNCLLVNNGFHNAHHRDDEAPFLNLHAQSMTLPGGYFQMLWATLFPPLWFSMMNRRAKALLR
ncbi:fatty acid desaturase [Paraburkholderia susongensis]|uniref:Alkane 1-monooxygenase n=1 Tax=Paraburkholderia susongensis TaxID=1515439 RepID=A0A1X7M5G1_9BURK|nr:fatty acid desaturase [Paraburkholderia susongensis]SMG61271.1 alkane 1-monooxygenase [Paraburkholderia susongensis]